jgi:hypothetical protein
VQKFKKKAELPLLFPPNNLVKILYQRPNLEIIRVIILCKKLINLDLWTHPMLGVRFGLES